MMGICAPWIALQCDTLRYAMHSYALQGNTDFVWAGIKTQMCIPTVNPFWMFLDDEGWLSQESWLLYSDKCMIANHDICCWLVNFSLLAMVQIIKVWFPLPPKTSQHTISGESLLNLLKMLQVCWVTTSPQSCKPKWVARCNFWRDIAGSSEKQSAFWQSQ